MSARCERFHNSFLATPPPEEIAHPEISSDQDPPHPWDDMEIPGYPDEIL